IFSQPVRFCAATICLLFTVVYIRDADGRSHTLTLNGNRIASDGMTKRSLNIGSLKEIRIRSCIVELLYISINSVETGESVYRNARLQKILFLFHANSAVRESSLCPTHCSRSNVWHAQL